MPTYQIINADCIEGMRQIPDESVHCVVTSPPYYGLRDYGTASWDGGDPECDHIPQFKHRSTRANDSQSGIGKYGYDGQNPIYKDICGKCGAVRIDQQIGLEDTPEAYVARLVDVFREVRRILRQDGTVWLNLGDSYAGSGKGPAGNLGAKHDERNMEHIHSKIIPSGLKAKDLIGIPWRVAFALQADGWWLRQDIIWHKPNPMPESVTDRCTKSHEYIFLLAKSEQYFYDHEAIKEEASMSSGFARQRLNHEASYYDASHKLERAADNHVSPVSLQYVDSGKRNRRSVWSVSTKPYPEAHFAVYPPKLVEPCVLAGSPTQCCATCGTGYIREMDIPKIPKSLRAMHGDDNVKVGYGHDTVNTTGGGQKMQDWRNANPPVMRGWKPNCACGTTDIAPAVVFDPFTGSGTTGFVALTNGRSFVGTELNPEYVTLAHQRLAAVQLQMW